MRPVWRARALLSGLWAGLLFGVGGLAAPALFASLDRVSAGRAAGRIFTSEAYASLALAVVLLALERALARDRGAEGAGGRGPQFTLALGLILLALAGTVAGHFGVQPLIAAAKAGQPGAWSFATLHAASTLLFAVKAVSVLMLAWHCTRAANGAPAATLPQPTAAAPSS